MSETTAGGLLWEALEDDDARKRQFITQLRRTAELSRENERLTARMKAFVEGVNRRCGVGPDKLPLLEVESVVKQFKAALKREKEVTEKLAAANAEKAIALERLSRTENDLRKEQLEKQRYWNERDDANKRLAVAKAEIELLTEDLKQFKAMRVM